MLKLKITLLVSLLIFTLSITSCNQNTEGTDAEVSEAGTEAQGSGIMYKIDTEKSVIRWTGRKITGKHEGTISLKEGQFWIKDQQVSGGKFNLNMKSITVTDLEGKDREDLETHLSDTDFFESDQFPTGRFVITEVIESKDTASTHTVKGNLTLKGITKGISFPAEIRIEKESLKASARFNINRTLWGITYKGKLDNAIQDEVSLEIELEGSPE